MKTETLTIIFGLFLVLKTVLGKEMLAKQFNVVPGGQTGTHVEKWGDVECEFSYVCQGGTLEEWEMMINMDDDGNYVCKVSRPDERPTTYLFFQSFQMAVRGARLTGAVVLGEKGAPCGEDEYVIDTDEHIVYSTSSFKSHLNKVFGVFKRDEHGREDL